MGMRGECFENLFGMPYKKEIRITKKTIFKPLKFILYMYQSDCQERSTNVNDGWLKIKEPEFYLVKTIKIVVFSIKSN